MAQSKKSKYPDASARRAERAEDAKTFRQVTVYFKPELLASVEKFKRARFMSTTAEAVRHLVVDGLQRQQASLQTP